MRLYKGEPFQIYRNSGTTSSFSLTASSRYVYIHNVQGYCDGGVGLGTVRIAASGTTLWEANIGSNINAIPLAFYDIGVMSPLDAGTLSCFVGTGSGCACVNIVGEYITRL